MKLTKKEAQEISDKYNLGKVLEVKYLEKGWVNYNFLIKTEKEKYVAKFINKIDKRKKERIHLQIEVLKFLKEKNFPYKIPAAVKNKGKKYISSHKNNPFWVYHFVEGEHEDKQSKKSFKEIAKCMAIYHKHIKSFGTKNDGDFFTSISWLEKEYRKIKENNPKNKMEEIGKENIDFFAEVLEKIKKIKYSHFLLIHRDFNSLNLLYKKDKIVGIIDFDNIQAAPRIMDIGISIVRNKYIERGFNLNKLNIFLEGYEEITKISKKEKEQIIPLILKEYCTMFWWYQKGNLKKKKGKYKSFRNRIKEAKELNKMVDWSKL